VVSLRIFPFALPDHLFVNRFGGREETANIVSIIRPRRDQWSWQIIPSIDGRVVDENIYAAPVLTRSRVKCFMPKRSTIETLNDFARRPCPSILRMVSSARSSREL